MLKSCGIFTHIEVIWLSCMQLKLLSVERIGIKSEYPNQIFTWIKDIEFKRR